MYMCMCVCVCMCVYVCIGVDMCVYGYVCITCIYIFFFFLSPLIFNLPPHSVPPTVTTCLYIGLYMSVCIIMCRQSFMPESMYSFW